MTIDTQDINTLRATVSGRYGAAARKVIDGTAAASCCGPATGSSGCCGSTSESWDPITANLYDEGQAAGIPAEALLASLGCGNPTALADLAEGEVVLDLGSGGGIDVLLSAKRVGPTGKAYGLDMTDDMLALANENKVREHPAAEQHRRRHHLELRHQPLRRQAHRDRRGIPRAEARRAIRGVGRRRAWRRARRREAEHGTLGRLCGRRARGAGVSRNAARRRLREPEHRADAYLQRRGCFSIPRQHALAWSATIRRATIKTRFFGDP